MKSLSAKEDTFLGDVWIVRGPPGSGKTTVSNLLGYHLPDAASVCVDNYRVDEGGSYRFDPPKMKDEVEKMKDEFLDFLHGGCQHVILDNVHSRLWEYAWAIDAAEKEGFRVHVIEVQADIFTCAERQSHKIPLDKLVEIFSRWESPLKIPDVQDLALRMLKALL